MQKITAELLGSGRILLDGKQVNLPFKQAEALVYYLLVEKETFRPKLADIIWGDSADEHKVQSNMRNAIYVIRREFGRDFLVGASKNVIQINDTHPALVIPELMRIFMDDAGMGWDEAWSITKNSVAYTNHTVLAEALECWPQTLFETLLPRIWQVIVEIAHRWQRQVEEQFHDPAKTEKLAIVWDGGVRMANLCIAGGMSVNGVSALHSEILRRDVFRDAYEMCPGQFRNVTNGVDHRRWLSQVNPGLHSLICDLTGDGYLLHPEQLQGLDAYESDTSVLHRLEEIKGENKARFAHWAKRQQGVILNTDAV